MKTVRAAFIKSLPVMGGYLILGTGFGILAWNNGYGLPWAFAMSLLMFAGSMQFVGIGLLSGGASLLTVILIFALTDETYSLLCDGQVPEGTDPDRFRFLVSLFNHSYWVLGSVLGSLAGSVLPFSTAGIEFSMTALFIASFTEQWITAKDHLPALTGLVCTLLCLLVFGTEGFLIPAMVLITLLLLLLRSRVPAERRVSE